MSETLLVSEVIFATRERLYGAWLDSKEHSLFTSDQATIEPVVGGSHSSFGGYATGQLLALELHRRIIKSWRTTEFPAGAPDSRVEITFEDTLGGTLVTILHTGIPSGQSTQYRDGWLRDYFAPMKSYFAKESAPDTVPDFDPGALAPAPARDLNGVRTKPRAAVHARPKAKAKTKAKAKPKAQAKPKAKVKVKVKVKAKPRQAAAAKKAAKPRKPKKAASAKKSAAKKKPAKRPAKPARKKSKAR